MARDPTCASDIKADDIPAGIIASCPMHQRVIRVAQSCYGCEHFAGVAELNGDPRVPWERGHLVLCRYRRKILMQRLSEPGSEAKVINGAVIAGG